MKSLRLEETKNALMSGDLSRKDYEAAAANDGLLFYPLSVATVAKKT